MGGVEWLISITMISCVATNTTNHIPSLILLRINDTLILMRALRDCGIASHFGDSINPTMYRWRTEKSVSARCNQWQFCAFREIAVSAVLVYLA